MKDRLDAYIQGLFAEAERRSPANRRLAELKEELLLNTREKYDDLVAMGKSPEAAYRVAVDGIGDISELLKAVAGGAVADEAAVDTPAVDTTADGEDADTARPPMAQEPEVSANGANRGGRDGENDDEDDEKNEDEDDENDEGEDNENDDEEARSGRPPRSRWYALVSGIIWTVILCAYFFVSFETHAWGVTWILFIMGIAADNVAKCIFDLRR